MELHLFFSKDLEKRLKLKIQWNWHECASMCYLKTNIKNRHCFMWRIFFSGLQYMKMKNIYSRLQGIYSAMNSYSATCTNKVLIAYTIPFVLSSEYGTNYHNNNKIISQVQHQISLTWFVVNSLMFLTVLVLAAFKH